MNRVHSRLRGRRDFGFRPWNDEDVFVIRSVLLDESNLLVDVALHPAAEWRVELGQIADLHRIADRRLATADFREAAIIATSSPASISNGPTCLSLRRFTSTISSSQKAVS